MRVELDGTELAQALKAGVAQRSGTLPILQCALLEASDGRLRVTTTDLQAQAVAELPAKVTEPGAICVNVSLLHAAARDGKMGLTQTDGQPMRAAPHGGSKLRIPTMPANEFPVSDQDDWQPLAIQPAELGRAIASVECASAKDDVRYYLNGVALKAGGVAATNGKRVGFYPIAYDGADAIIPLPQLDAFARMLTADAEVHATFDHGARITKLRVRNGKDCLSVTVLDGRFPDVESIVAEPENERWAIFDRKKLVDAINRFRPFATEKIGFHVYLQVDDGAAYLHSKDRENTENVSWALGKFGTPFEMAINADDVGRICDAIGTEKVRIVVSDCQGRKNGAIFIAADDASKSPACYVTVAVDV